MILNEIKCHVNTSLGLVGGCIPCFPPCVRACRRHLQKHDIKRNGFGEKGQNLQKDILAAVKLVITKLITNCKICIKLITSN